MRKKAFLFMFLFPLIFISSISNVAETKGVERDFDYLCEATGEWGDFFDDVPVTVTYETDVPESVEPGEDFNLSNTSFTMDVSQGGFTLTEANFSVSAENEDSIIEASFEDLDLDLSGEPPFEFSFPAEGDLGPIVAGESGEVIIKADDLEMTAVVEIAAGNMTANYQCSLEEEDSMIAMIPIEEDQSDVQNIEEDIQYECNVQVSIIDLDFDMDTTIYATAPETVAPGEESSAINSYLEAWIPGDVVSTINTVLQADYIEGEASQFYVHAENLGDTVNVADPAITIPETPVPEEGPLQLIVPEDQADAGLEAGPFEAGQEGEMVFSAGDIYVELAPTNNPDAVMEASCTPADEEDATLTIIPIEEDGEDPPEVLVGSIELDGNEEMELEVGDDFEDPGFTVVDEEGNNITDEVEVSVEGEVDTTVAGTNELHYFVEDNEDIDPATRTVTVAEPDEEDPPEDLVGSVELDGSEEMELEVGDDFEDPGFTVVDEEGSNITDEVEVSVEGEVDTTIAGTYELNYFVEDNEGIDPATRTVTVVEPDEEDPPEDLVGSIELDGSEEMELEVGDDFEDPGFTVVDEEGSNITDEVEVSVEGEVDTTTAGTYELNYFVEDNEDIDPATRTITVVEPDEEDPPEDLVESIELDGSEEMGLEVGDDFEDPGFTVVDEEGNNITDEVEVSVEGEVDTTAAGTYELHYFVEDNEDIDPATRTVNVAEPDEEDPPEAPVGSIELDGNEEMELEVGDDFEDPGFTVVDEEGNNITDEVEVSVEGEVDTTAAGTYELHYFVEDNEDIDPATRTVTVAEPDEEDPPEAPVGSIELDGNEEMELEVGDDFEDPGFTVVDEEGNNITDEVEVSVEGEVDTTAAGTYELHYFVEDNEDIDPATRTVVVSEPDEEDPPEAPAGSINLDGNEEMELEVGDDFEDPGFTVVDEEGNNITDEVEVSVEGEVDTTAAGTYELHYFVEVNEDIDPATRTVVVSEPDEEDPPEAPAGSINLDGNEEMELEVGDDFEDPGFTVVDEEGNNITDEVEVSVEGEVDTTAAGTYELHYFVEVNEDIDPATRTVVVSEPDEEDPAEGNFLSGMGVPAGDLGEVGDHYLDTESMELFVKQDADDWGTLGTFEGNVPTVEDGSMFTDEGAPAAELGQENNLYFDTLGNEVYEKTADGWELIADVVEPGDEDPPEDPEDPAGVNFFSDVGAPEDDFGDVGDHYLNTDNMELYVYDEDDGWTSLGILQGDDGEPGPPGEDGEDGTMFYTGEGEPSAELGEEGDLYLDTETGKLYENEAGEWEHIFTIPDDESAAEEEKGQPHGPKEDKGNGENGSDSTDEEEGGALPDTAGSTPLMILIGSLLAIGGGALLFRRKLALT
ncbi:immunoglobulin-like domain-containing protein [Salicibibacter kimchii]|uniref:DUF5011 domain-containing protein n=1 Tax=Salicibibacter kimchii TaxID=2099786 RepID=A0A345C100_9BACI|nr:immunoglobulin-like domain-containing protein [Salicibibacter kimchii]AXF56881.1 DUF5011 domain-containing protein [Salicibibacter kimchii]